MSFATDPSLFPQQLDIAGDRVLLVKMSEEDFRAASFLDQRILTDVAKMEWAGWPQLEGLSDASLPNDARWIFHIGHVGSTLISRLLGEARNALALREPFVLRQMAEMAQMDGRAHSHWAPGRYSHRLGIAISWLSRSFGPDQFAVIKATSFTNDIAGDILAAADAPVLFVTLSPERYILTILAGDNSRSEMAALSSHRLERLHARLGETPFRLWDMDEAQRAAMAWACETSALAACTAGRPLWTDFDGFLADPAAGLFACASHLGLEITPDEAAALVGGPILQQYSKAPEHSYSPRLREDLLAQAARDHGPAVRQALRWLDDAAARYPAIAKGMDLSNARKSA